MSNQIYENLRDFLAVAWPRASTAATFLSPLGIQEADFPNGATTRTIWHKILKDNPTKIAEIAAAAKKVYPNLESRIDELVRSYDPFGQVAPPAILWQENPYVGLSSIQDPAWFFGRRAATTALLDKITTHHFVTVYGSSGIGKSSLLRAGLIPAWRQVQAVGGAGKRAVCFTPGSDPFTSLFEMGLNRMQGAQAIIDKAREVGNDDLFEQLRTTFFPTQQLLVVVDQGEQLFHRLDPATIVDSSTGPGLRERFLRCLFDPSINVRFIVAMRGDYFEEWSNRIPAGYDQQFTLRPPDEDDLRDIILLPARGKGVEFEVGLAQELIDKLSNGLATLPLLQVLLKLLWDRDKPEDAVLNRDSYEQLGRVEGALQQQIEAFIARHPGREMEIRHLFLSLIRFDLRAGNYHAAAKPCPVGNLPRDLVDDLMGEKCRLVTNDQNQIMFAHEAVILAWPGFAEIRTKHGEILSIHDDLTECASRWTKAATEAEKSEELWRGSSLRRATELAGMSSSNGCPDQFLLAESPLAPVPEVSFLVKSIATAADVAEKEQKSRNFRRKAFIGTGILAFLASISAGIGFSEAKTAEKARQDTEEALRKVFDAAARANKQIALRNKQNSQASLKALGASRDALKDVEEEGEGLAHLAEAVRYDALLPQKGRRPAIRADALERLLQRPNVSDGPERYLGPESGGKLVEILTPDRRFVLLETGENKLQVWDLLAAKAAGEPVPQPGPPVTQPGIDRDEQELGSVAATNIKGDERTAALPANPQNSWCSSNDGKFLGVNSGSQVVVYDVSSGDAVFQFDLGKRSFQQMAISCETRKIFIALDGEVKVWSMDHLEEGQNTFKVPGYVAGFVISSDEKWFLAQTDSSYAVFDLAKGKLAFTPIPRIRGKVSMMICSNSQQMLVTQGDAVVRYKMDTGRMVGSPVACHLVLANCRPAAPAAILSPDGAFMALAEQGGVKVYRVDDNGEEFINGKQFLADNVVFSPDGKLLGLAKNEGQWSVWDFEFDQLITYPDPIDSERLHPLFFIDSAHVATLMEGQRITEREVSSRDSDGENIHLKEELSDLTENTPINFESEDLPVSQAVDPSTPKWQNLPGNPVISPKGLFLIGKVEGEHFLGCWKKGPSCSQLSFFKDIREGQISFDPDERFVLVSEKNQSRVWDLVNGSQQGNTIPIGSYDPKQIAINKDSAVAIASGNNVQIWDKGKNGAILSADSPVREIRFNPSEDMLAVCCDENIQFWSNEKGRFDSLEVEASNISFSRDGRWMATKIGKHWQLWDSRERIVVGGFLEFEPKFGVSNRWLYGAPLDSSLTASGVLAGRLLRVPLELPPVFFDTRVEPGKIGLPEILETIGGKVVASSGEVKSLSPEEVIGRREELRQFALDPLTAPAVRDFCLWLLAPTSERPIAPYSKATIEGYIEEEIDSALKRFQMRSDAGRSILASDIIGVLARAYALNPQSPLIHFALAVMEKNERRKKFLVDYGMKRLPADAAVCAKAARILLLCNDVYSARVALDKGVALAPNLPELVKARSLVEAAEKF